MDISSQSGDSGISPDSIRAQVANLTSSDALDNSPRLKELLNYIVEEYLAGREQGIKGITIGNAIYAADDDFDPDENNIVRVEMGRLRRRLAEYYAAAGQADPVIVEIPKGSYVPVFTHNPEFRKNDARRPPVPSPGFALKVSLALLVTALLAWLVGYMFFKDEPAVVESGHNTVLSDSQNSEAEILFGQAFILLMPPSDHARVKASIDLFRRVIDIDSDFPGGYAGHSIALSFQVLFVKSGNPDQDLRESLTLAKTAVDQGPDYPLAFAARALAQSLNGETESALENARRVLTIQPPDERANAIVATALVVSGRPSEAIELLMEALKLNPNETRTPYLNILGVAQYSMGDYSEAAKSIDKNLARKGPTSPHMDTILAASYLQMGETFKARAIIEKLHRTNPDFPIEAWLANFIKPADELQAIATELRSLGIPLQ